MSDTESPEGSVPSEGNMRSLLLSLFYSFEFGDLMRDLCGHLCSVHTSATCHPHGVACRTSIAGP